MNSFLATIATLAVITGGGSIAYYYGVYLPEKDAAAKEQARQRANPTPEQQQAQKEANIRAMQEQDKKMKSYSDCMMASSKAMQTHVTGQCSHLNGNGLL